jgi:hypothetical protein
VSLARSRNARFKRRASHAAAQLVRAGIAALACSGWSAPAPVASGGHSSPPVSADGGGSTGALGVRKQARDIMSGGWSRGGSAKSPDACAPQPRSHSRPHSRPQHVQGTRVSYTQRPGSKGSQLQREVSFDAHAHFNVQYLSIADDSCDGDEYYHCQRSGRSGSSSGRWLSSHRSHISARPSSPDVLQDVAGGDGLGGRPSTPSIAPAATVPRLLSEAGAIRRSLEHLDLTGNRQAL